MHIMHTTASSLVAIAQFFDESEHLWPVPYGNQQKFNIEAVNDYLPIQTEISDCKYLLFDPPCRQPVKSVPRGKAIWIANCGFVSVLLTHLFFVRLTISQQPAGRFTPKFACGRSLGRDVTSPLLGVGGPRRAEKGANEIFVTMGVNGEFLHFGGFWAISQQRVHGSTPNIICIGTMSVYVPPMGSIVPWGTGGGGVKNSKNGGSHSCCGQLPFLFLSAMPNVVQYVGHRLAHILM